MVKSGIYKISSKIKPIRVYVGSAINIPGRWATHLSRLKNNKHHSKKLQRHFNKYGIDDLVFSIMENCEKENLLPIEQRYIDFIKPYFNICPTAGSSFGIKLSEEHKNKIKKAFADKVYSDEDLEKFKSFKGKKHSEETKAKISKSNKGKVCSKEARENMSKAAKGKQIRLGAKLSEETKRKIGEANKRHTIWAKGKKFTDLHRQHIKESWVLRKQKKIA